MRLFVCFILGCIILWGNYSYAATLDDVRARGHLICGVDEQHYGFAYMDTQGGWKGFEVDFCRGLAAALFGSTQYATFVPLNAKNRFSVLRDGEVDILLRSTTWTYTRDSAFGVDYPGITFYDQLGILAHKSFGETTFEKVKKASLCVADGTTTLETIKEYIEISEKDISVKVFNSREGLNNFFFSGQCDLYAADTSALRAIVAFSAPNPDDYIMLKTSLSKEPLGPVVRDNDAEWYDIIKWLVYGLIEAEERGITQNNIEHMKANRLHAVRFMLGVESGLGAHLRLDDAWLAQAIKAVGNYGEIFERNLGTLSHLKMERGLNDLWKNGGLMYAMPIR